MTIARALLRRLSWESRTSFGAPVDPDVLSSSARSGCRVRRTMGRRALHVQLAAVDVDDGIGCPRLGEAVGVLVGEQRHVVAGEEREVGRHELDRARRLEHDE